MRIARVTKFECISLCAALGLSACSHGREQTGGVTGVPTAGVAVPAAGSGVSVAQAGGTAPAAGGGAAVSGAAGAAAGSGGVPDAGGALATAGSSGVAGLGGAGGAGAGAAGAGPGTTHADCSLWPAAVGEQQVSATIQVNGKLDGKLKRYVGSGALGGSGQDEGQDPLFELADGATLENVVIGSPAADGVHCRGSCTLRNVWWQDVGEDAATLLGSSASQVMKIECGGAKAASDKVFQHNGPGTMIISNFDV